MKSLLPGLASLVILLTANAALACAGGEPGSDAGWSLDRRQFAGDTGLPFLSPGNDSRINLQMLMMDAKPWPVDTTQLEKAPNARDLQYGVILFERSVFDDVFRSERAAPTGPSQAGKAPDLADGEGSRCASLGDGAQAFAAAAEAEAGLAANERTALVDARTRMSSTCGDQANGTPASDFLASLPQPSAAAREFAIYLAGAKDFYDGAFDQAVAQFASLAGAQNAWVKETARYMIGRAQLNKAQVGAFADFDQSAQPRAPDKSALADAAKAFSEYLADYPAGRYATSARGLNRRLFWLAGDRNSLAADYGQLLVQGFGPKSIANSVDFAEEVDLKFLRPDGTLSHDANLLAVADLVRFRTDNPKKPAFSAGDLEAQAPDFQGHEALFGFLRAARAYYVDNDVPATLRWLGPAQYGPLTPAYLAFSRETLRGQALLASGQFELAADHWQKLLPLAVNPWQKEAVELGLAMSWERAGSLNKVFLPDTRISSPRIRVQVLTAAAGPILLRQAVADPLSLPEERRLARFVLLYKEATRGQYANFLRDFSPESIARDLADAPKMRWARSEAFNWAGAGEPFACPGLKPIVERLAANPGDAHALMCFSEFTRRQGLDEVETVPGRDELGGAKPIFPGKPYSRGDIYRKLIADPAAPAADRAYALYRAVNCYAPSGNNDCRGQDVPKAQRAAWYNELKTKYGATPWARSLRFYW